MLTRSNERRILEAASLRGFDAVNNPWAVLADRKAGYFPIGLIRSCDDLRSIDKVIDSIFEADNMGQSSIIFCGCPSIASEIRRLINQRSSDRLVEVCKVSSVSFEIATDLFATPITIDDLNLDFDAPAMELEG